MKTLTFVSQSNVLQIGIKRLIYRPFSIFIYKTVASFNNMERRASKRRHIKIKAEEKPIVSKYVVDGLVFNTNKPVKEVNETKTSPEKYSKLVQLLNEDEETLTKKEKEDTWTPQFWKKALKNILEMRSAVKAPVDDLGCDKCCNELEPPNVQRYQILIALMLSSQTKDEVTFHAMQQLREHGLTIENILNTGDKEIARLISKVGFAEKKSKYIKETTQILRNEYNDDIPDTVEKLCQLKGVGPKMAHICMQVAWNKVTGIGVDTHVHRVSNRMGWVRKPTKTPEQTRKGLEEWLPSDGWGDVNHLLVGFGQTICKPVNPKCSECLNNGFCPKLI